MEQIKNVSIKSKKKANIKMNKPPSNFGGFILLKHYEIIRRVIS